MQGTGQGRSIAVSLPYLPWVLVCEADGDGDGDGVARWRLREHAAGDVTMHPLAVPDRPTAAELARAMRPVCGRPVADALVTQAAAMLARAMADDGDEARRGSEAKDFRWR